ncbi:MAG: helix-turn-helix transcriptional regulator [Lachnospiraceae bacterium]|nr:helix-turn-helix transcriptional regulator [Lachnospiraceae bacterium]
MAKTVGALIREARTAAGLTQEQLARKVDGMTASGIGKAERGETELTQEVLKQIAKATGVTQASLINASRAASGKKTGKKTTGKTAGKTAGSTTGKTTGRTAGKSGTAAVGELKLTATEKTLVQLYRKADSGMKKVVMSLLKGEKPETGEILETLVGGAMNMLGKKK